jgi:two-component system response regulator
MNEGDSVEILLVEDNPHDAELTLRAFRKRNLADKVVVVEDGQEALDFLFSNGAHAGRAGTRPPRVILLDVKLPKVSGFEVLRIIKSDDRTRATPVVVVTSSHEDPDIRTAYELGANSYVVKPVDFDSFMEAMSSVGFYWLVVNRRTS